MAIAGRIMPLPKGDYRGSIIYEILDVVSHNNKAWMCKKPNTVGIEPSKENDEYWQLLMGADITNADTLDDYHADHFMSKEEFKVKMEEFAVTFDIAFAADGWSEEAPHTQTIEVEGITENDTFTPSLVDDTGTEMDLKALQKSYSCFSYFDSGEGSITATCKYKKPETDVTVSFKR